MNVYRIFDKDKREFIKIGKRSNDIYVNKSILEGTLKRYYNIDDIYDRFKIIEYTLVRKEEKD